MCYIRHWMGKLHEETAGMTTLDIVIGVLVLIVISSIGLFVLQNEHPTKKTAASTTAAQSGTSAGTAATPYAVLSPATVASKTAECSQQITYASNGNSGPVTCANDDLNVLEWNALAALEPTVMSLGYNATAAQVQSALCADAKDSSSDANTSNSNIIEATTYQISALYYGWHFSPDPSAVLSNGTC
jgi:hypothetical protein